MPKLDCPPAPPRVPLAFLPESWGWRVVRVAPFAAPVDLGVIRWAPSAGKHRWVAARRHELRAPERLAILWVQRHRLVPPEYQRALSAASSTPGAPPVLSLDED